MNFTAQQITGQDLYRVVLVLPQTKLVLVECLGKELRLPCVSIPKWTRPAEQLAKCLKEKLNLSSVIIAFLANGPATLPCAVIEVRTCDWNFALYGLMPMGIDNLDNHELTTAECVTILSILTGDVQHLGPFSRLGWIDEAQDWIRESVPHHAVKFSEDIRQLNATANFALVRFGTLQGPAYWLKATGTPNRHEYNVTTTLAGYFPHFLPPIVAAREDWNAWAMEEAGQPLYNCFTLPVLQEAVCALAELQKQSVFRIDQLLNVGCFDGRITVLRTHLRELIDYLEEVMEQQTSLKVPRLQRNRLRHLECILDDACSEMHELGIPDSLILNDANPGNILFDGSRCVFIDWAEACVGNPFLTLQQLLVGAVKTNEEAHSRALEEQGLDLT